MRYLPKLHQLRIFHEVVRRGSIRAAARQLQQPQPAVSRSLRDLEYRLNAMLVVRGRLGVTLTPIGRLFARRVARIFAELQLAEEEFALHHQGCEETDGENVISPR